jgi:putative DNA primase/helicase
VSANSIVRHRPSSSAAAAWRARAEDLARWAKDRLVNRTDVWGTYRPLDRRQQGNSWTAPAKSIRGQVFLTQDVLVRHFRGDRPEEVVGLHTTSPANTSLWGAVEVDRHGDGGNDAEANLASVLAWYRCLTEMGFRPLLTDSNGVGGYHLRALCSEPVPTPRVFAFLRWLTADHVRHGLPARPETFPKQPTVAAPGRNGQYGNWLRLPGRHHSREHWSRVWDGSRWLKGEAAVAFIVSLTGDAPELIPAEVQQHEPPAVSVTVRFVPAHAPGRGSLAARIRAYMAKLPNLGEAQGRDDVAYQFAAFLARDLALSDEAALRWLGEWDQNNNPPKGTDRLLEILENVCRYGRHAIGCGADWR